MKRKPLYVLLAACILTVVAAFATVIVASADSYKEGIIEGTTGNGTKGSPVQVSTYAQLKAALQSPDVKYVEVAKDIVYDLKYCHQAEHLEAQRNNAPHPGDYHYDRSTDSCSYTAIRIRACNGEKHLKLSNNVIIGLKERNYQFLRSLMTFYGYGSETLYIEGPGIISGEFNDNVQNFGGSVLSIEGTGNLNVSGVKMYSNAVFYNFGANALNLDTTGNVILKNSEFYGSHYTKDADFANEIVFGRKHFLTAAVRIGNKCNLDISGCTFGALKGTNVKVTGLAFANSKLVDAGKVKISDSHFETGLSILEKTIYDGSIEYNSTSFVYLSINNLAADNNVPYGYETEKSGVTVSEAVFCQRPEATLSFTSGGKTYAEDVSAISLNSGKCTVKAELRIPEVLANVVSAENVSLCIGLPEYKEEILRYGKKMPEKRAGENFRIVELSYNADFFFDKNQWANNHRYVTFKINLKSGLNSEQSIYSDSIARLVMIEKPVYPITGNIYYTDSCYFGHSLTASVSAKVNNSSVPESDLVYQWQIFKSGKWTNINGAAKSRYTPTASDVGNYIRLTVSSSSDRYEGTLIGSKILVEKAPQDKPSSAVLTASSPYNSFTVGNFDSACEYVYSTDAPSASNIGKGTSFRSKTVTGLIPGKYYYVYVRHAETATHKASAWVGPSAVVMSAEVWLQKIYLCDTPGGRAYTDYGDGNKIYIKAGETKTLYINKFPSAANKWYDLTFRQENNAASDVRFTPSTSKAPNMPESIKITAAKKGSYRIGAYKPGNNDAVGRWTLVVYSDISEIPASQITVVDPPVFSDTTLCIGDSIPAPEYGTILTRPDGAFRGYTFEWRVVKPAASSAGTPSYVTDNGYISIDKNGKITGKAANGKANSYYSLVVLCAVKNGNVAAAISSYKATVLEKETIPLEKLELNPSEMTLHIGDTGSIRALLTPANPTGIKVEYLSSNSSIVSVDKNGNIKALKVGTVKINVRAGSKIAVCTVTVVDPSHTHKLGKSVDAGDGTHYAQCTVAGCSYRKTGLHDCSSWKKSDDSRHTGTCSCGAKITKAHSFIKTSAAFPTLIAGGSETYTCTDCGATKTAAIAKAEAIGTVSVTVPYPEIGAMPGDAVPDGENYIVSSAVWSPAAEKFDDAQYTVTVKLCAMSGYRFAPNCALLICGQNAALISPAEIPSEGADEIEISLTFAKPEDGKYNISISGGTASAATAEKGQTITVKAEVPDGKEFDRWEVVSGGITLADAGSPETTFIMQEQNVEIRAIFVESGHIHTPGTEWFYDDTAHWHICTDCGGKTDVVPHSFRWVTDTKASLFSDGSKHEACSICGFRCNENTSVAKTSAILFICAGVILAGAAAAAIIIIIKNKKKKENAQ